jgi:hypothetical protein
MTPLTAVPLAASVELLHRLRTVTLRNPGQDADHLRRRLTRGAIAELDVDLRILLAEALQRHRDVGAALDTAADAARAAASLPPRDRSRLIMALAVGADLAVCAGLDEAVEACDSYLNATTYDNPPNLHRVLLAGALRAVAVYQGVDCQQGRHLLTTLSHRFPSDNARTVTTVQAGIAAMTAGCRPRRPDRPSGPPPPLPGGVLHPSLADPPGDYLAYRVRAHAADVHTCGTAPDRTLTSRPEATP